MTANFVTIQASVPPVSQLLLWEVTIKIILILLTVTLCVTTTSFAAMPGDFNSDGKVSINEVQQVINSYLGLYVPPPAAVLGDIQILSLEPFEIFRTSTAATCGVKFTAINTGTVRANLTIVYQAKTADDTVLLERSLNWGLDADPNRISPMQVSSFTLTPAQYETARWVVTSILIN